MPQKTTIKDPVDAVGAVNEFHQDGEWVQLAPFGRWDNVVGLQVFSPEDGREMVNEFQRLLNAPSRLLGLPWYVGHPDHEPLKQRYKDTRAYGRIKELEAREDGIYGRVKFSAAGRQMIEDEAFHGHSVNWAMKRGADGQLHPFRLKSVGWTNEPNIPVAPITAANELQDPAMREKLLEALGLAADATDDDIMNAITALKEPDKDDAPAPPNLPPAPDAAANERQIAAIKAERDAMKAERDAEKARAATAETQAVNERHRSRDLLVSQGVREGKILVSEQNAWKTKFDTDFTEAANELQNAKPKLNTSNRVGSLGVRNANLNTDRSMQIQDAVNERRAKFPQEAYDQSFAAVKKANPELFAAQAA